MKIRHWFCLTLIAAAPFAGFACSKDSPAEEVIEPPKVSSPDEKLVTYKVTGMTCESCEGHIRKELGKLPNVTKVVASHAQEKAWMIVKGDAPSKDAVEKAIKAAGPQYKVVSEG
ncbi:MAG: heavy-metal-associated domain-containing protein [Phycisphaerales bacterium]|nr:heavy-metal-associated domain-containing protein [Phycisphaerales bacterium]